MREKIAEVILNHWVIEVPHKMYPAYVRCMAEGCGWEGQFPGDISEHNADLIMELLEAAA